MNLKVGKFELDVPFSEKRSPTLNTPFVMYHYVAGTPYFAGITGTSTSFYNNPNSFAIGGNSPGIEMAGITKTAVTDGFFRYSLAGLSTNTFSGPVSCPPQCQLWHGRAKREFLRPCDAVVWGLWHCHRPAHRVVRHIRECSYCGECHLSRLSGRMGADVSFTYDGQWNLFGAFVHGNDSKNLFMSQGITNAQNASWNGAFVELDWYPTQLPLVGSPGWFFAYRYDLIRNDRQGNATFAKNYNNVDSHTFLIRYFIHQSNRTDIAVHAEYVTYRTEGVGTNFSGGGGTGNGACAPACGNLLGQTMLVGLDFAY